MTERGRPESIEWPPVLENAKVRDLTVGEVAREQGVPYGTVYTAAKRYGFQLNTNGRRKRWDGLRTVDRVKGYQRIENTENFQGFPEPAFRDLSENQRLSQFAPESRPVTAPNAIYVIEEAGGEWCKVGISAANDANRRIRELRLGNPRGLEIVFMAPIDDARKTERVVHSKLWTRRPEGAVRSEWFHVTAQEAIAAIQEALAEDVAVAAEQAA